MVYDAITKDWVPRYGYKSVKKIQEKQDWVLEDKPSHGDLDPFTYKSQQKKLKLEKEKLKQMKNEMKG